MKRAHLFSVIAAVTCVTAAARADDKQACVDAFNAGQDLRGANKLVEARKKLLECAREACPAMVKTDCANALNDVQASVPTVVFSAVDANNQDLVNVTVTADGQKLQDRLEGQAVMLDPGVHQMKYEVQGSPPKEDRVVVRAGEKNRLIKISFGLMNTAPGGKTYGGEEPASTGGGVPASAIVLGAVGVVALGSFTYFGLKGKNDASDLRSKCAPNCAQSDVDAVKQKLLIADISLAVGVVAIGAAVYFTLTNKTPATTSAHFDLKPAPGGGVATLGGTF